MIVKTRDQIKTEDTWDLTKLFGNFEEWEKEYSALGLLVNDALNFKGTLGTSKENLITFLEWFMAVQIRLERVMQYAFLLHAGDALDTDNQRTYSLATNLANRFSTAVSFVDSEILSIDENLFSSWIESKEFEPYRVYLKKLVRFRNHILSDNEEKILAMQAQVGSKAQESFGALTNVDFDFGYLIVDGKRISLTQSTFSYFLQHPDRSVRKKAYHKFYNVFYKHQNVLAHLYDASVKQDIFKSKVRSYDDSLTMFLFPDNVDKKVYENLVDSVNRALPVLHRYYEIRRKVLNLKELSHYDVYVPLIKEIKVKHTYEEAVEVIKKALQPLGEEYVSVLTEGLTTQRWVDRYENKGKRSGAFSSGIFSSNPFILMNYQEEVLRDVFTLAHEAGHAMHSYYSSKNNPFASYDYTIFEAEVASTFNEQLLADYMLKNSNDTQMEAYIIGKQIDDIVATLFRQTMFAEYEKVIHQMVEGGEPITVSSLRSNYNILLEKYFGNNVKLFAKSSLEGLRIPHFYRAFYVYKYATGISAAISLAKRVLEGDKQDKDRYLEFLKSGGSRYPIEALKLAGVDMQDSKPIDDALFYFESLLNRFEELVLTKV